MDLTPSAQKLFDKIVTRNESRIVTIDDLITYKTYQEADEIIAAIKELIAAELIITQPAINHGRFETEIIPLGGITYRKGTKKPLSSSTTIRRKK